MINSIEAELSFLKAKFNILYRELVRMGLEIKVAEKADVLCPQCNSIVQSFYRDLDSGKYVSMSGNGISYDVKTLEATYQYINCAKCGAKVGVRYVQ